VLTSKPIKLKPDEVQTVLPGASDTTPVPSTSTDSSAPSAAQTTNETAAKTSGPRVLGLDITLADALELQKLGAMFVDARDRAEYEAGHIADAFWLPAKLFYESNGTPEALNYIGDKNTILVIYCGGGACDASHNTARLLQEVGYKRTHILTDGYPAWAGGGHPTGSGKPFYE
jgi:rhodanese-related sulfurtransferase